MDEVKNCTTCVQMDQDICLVCTMSTAGVDPNNWIGKSTKDALQKGVNPKDAIGAAKNPHGCISRAVLAEVGLAMMEGSRKYGRHNYRVAPVRAEVYFDAANRHLDAWWEGEDIDPDSGLPHLTKAIACLFVIQDAIIQGVWYDDRPPVTPAKHDEFIKQATADILKRFPKTKPPFTEKEHGQGAVDIDHPCHSQYCSRCREAIKNAKEGETVLICKECSNV